MIGTDYEDKAKISAGMARLIFFVFIILQIFVTIWLADRWYFGTEFAFALGFTSIMTLLLFRHMWESIYQMLRYIAKLTREGHYNTPTKNVEQTQQSQTVADVFIKEAEKTGDDYQWELVQHEARKERE